MICCFFFSPTCHVLGSVHYDRKTHANTKVYQNRMDQAKNLHKPVFQNTRFYTVSQSMANTLGLWGYVSKTRRGTLKSTERDYGRRRENFGIRTAKNESLNFLAWAFVVRMARVQTQIQSPQWLALKVLSLAFSEREHQGRSNVPKLGAWEALKTICCFINLSTDMMDMRCFHLNLKAWKKMLLNFFLIWFSPRKKFCQYLQTVVSSKLTVTLKKMSEST